MKLSLRVKTHKKENKAYWEPDFTFETKEKVLIVETKESPIDGKANKSVIETVAKFFKVAKKDIFIKSGHTSKNKIILIKQSV